MVAWAASLVFGTHLHLPATMFGFDVSCLRRVGNHTVFLVFAWAHDADHRVHRSNISLSRSRQGPPRSHAVTIFGITCRQQLGPLLANFAGRLRWFWLSRQTPLANRTSDHRNAKALKPTRRLPRSNETNLLPGPWLQCAPPYNVVTAPGEGQEKNCKASGAGKQINIGGGRYPKPTRHAN